MLNLLATLVVSALPASPGAIPAAACADPAPASADDVSVGECDQAAPLDLWYRMSRFADSEPGGVGAGPARHLRPSRGIASCDARQIPAQVSSPQAPAVALFALPALLPVQVPPHFDADAHALPARALAPPDRPPRA